MRKLMLSATLIFAGLFAHGANAMPFGSPAAPDNPLVQKADYACGRGFHLSPRGYCRPNGPPRGYYGGWDGRDRWEQRREWRERQARREWRDRRDSGGWYYQQDYRW